MANKVPKNPPMQQKSREYMSNENSMRKGESSGVKKLPQDYMGAFKQISKKK